MGREGRRNESSRGAEKARRPVMVKRESVLIGDGKTMQRQPRASIPNKEKPLGRGKKP